MIDTTSLEKNLQDKLDEILWSYQIDVSKGYDEEQARKNAIYRIICVVKAKIMKPKVKR